MLPAVITVRHSVRIGEKMDLISSDFLQRDLARFDLVLGFSYIHTLEDWMMHGMSANFHAGFCKQIY